MCALTLKGRDEDALRQSLRYTAMTLPEREAVGVVELLNRSITDDDRQFLQRLA
mgnify:CR=1 FL=1